MKKETSEIEPHHHPFTDDHPLMQWLEQYGKTALVVVLALLALLFLVYRISSTHTAKAEADYLEAAQQYALFQKNDDKIAYGKLEEILARRPELQSKYDGLLVQIFIDRNEPKQAEEYARRVFARVRSDHLPAYEEFAAITLKISQGDFAGALKQSQDLKQMLLKAAVSEGQGRTFGDLLFAYNLLRIAMLEGKTGNAQGEQEAWSEWNTYAKASINSASIKAAAFYTLDALFGEGSLTLNDYIKSRGK